MNHWTLVSYPLQLNESIPDERKVVLVWLKEGGLPFCGYIRYAAGCKDSPYFVVYHGNSDIGAKVVAWCDCLPDSFQDIKDKLNKIEQTDTKEREDRAFEALIVWTLRKAGERDIDVNNLPELTEKDKAALDSLGPDFMKNLIEGNK